MIRDHRSGELLDGGVVRPSLRELGGIDVDAVGGDGDMRDFGIGEVRRRSRSGRIGLGVQCGRQRERHRERGQSMECGHQSSRREVYR